MPENRWTNVKDYGNVVNRDGLICSRCNLALEPQVVQITYLKNLFPTKLLCCPQCGLAYMPEDVALTKVLEVEKTLEDK